MTRSLRPLLTWKQVVTENLLRLQATLDNECFLPRFKGSTVTIWDSSCTIYSTHKTSKYATTPYFFQGPTLKEEGRIFTDQFATNLCSKIWSINGMARWKSPSSTPNPPLQRSIHVSVRNTNGFLYRFALFLDPHLNIFRSYRKPAIRKLKISKTNLHFSKVQRNRHTSMFRSIRCVSHKH